MLPSSSHLTRCRGDEASDDDVRSRRDATRDLDATRRRDDAQTKTHNTAMPTRSCIVSRAQSRHRGRALLRRAAVATAAALYRRGRISPWSYDIVTMCADWSRAEAALLAWTVARWSELATIDPLRCARGSTIYLSCGKTQSRRRLEPVPEEVRSEWQAVRPGTIPADIPATTARRQIRAAANAAGVRRLRGAQDSTHIFRHLRASWRAEQGWSLDAIAEELGHASTESTQHYIHDLDDLISSRKTTPL